MIVGKRKAESARVRIYGRVVEKPVEQSVQLHDEKIVVELDELLDHVRQLTSP